MLSKIILSPKKCKFTNFDGKNGAALHTTLLEPIPVLNISLFVQRISGRRRERGHKSSQRCKRKQHHALHGSNAEWILEQKKIPRWPTEYAKMESYLLYIL